MSDGYARLHAAPEPFDRTRLGAGVTQAANALLGALLIRDEHAGAVVDDAVENEGARGRSTSRSGETASASASRDGSTIARVVEAEAYREDDPASHSHAKRTTRSEPMFWGPGTAYVYRSYGVHWCCNVSVEADGVGAAVLLRAAVVLQGHAAVRARRGAARRDRELLRGPGCLSAGLAIDGRLDRGDLIDGVGGVRLADDGWRPEPHEVVAGPRVGVRLAPDLAWRFWLQVPETSAYRRSPRATAAPGGDAAMSACRT